MFRGLFDCCLNIFIELFISEIVHTENSFLLKLYYQFNFATEPTIHYDSSKVSIKRSTITEQNFQKTRVLFK
uniref:Uncharacterized protein n=1 Tax=Staphylococcus aureus TaxID=1280 RepID=A0A499S6I3_STAAU|nr:hypothetical protein D0Y80_l00025 [Staphylococcus aureus]